MPTNREVHQFLSGKLKFVRNEGSHSKYALPRKLNRALPIMLPFHLQHGRNDVSAHILKQIEKVLGVSQHELTEAMACHYGDLVLYMSLLATALGRLVDECIRDPVVYEDLLVAFCDATSGYVAAVRADCKAKKLRAQEIVMINRMIALLDDRRTTMKIEPRRVRAKTEDAIGVLVEMMRSTLDADRIRL